MQINDIDITNILSHWRRELLKTFYQEFDHDDFNGQIRDNDGIWSRLEFDIESTDRNHFCRAREGKIEINKKA